jgi:hypothetical protein
MRRGTSAPSRGPRAAELLTAHNRNLDDCGLRAAGSRRARHSPSSSPALLRVRVRQLARTSAVTLTSPAFSNVSVRSILSPALRSAVSSMSMMW